MSTAQSPAAEVISDPTIRNGEPVIGGTATPVRAVVELWNLGVAPEAIPIRLPHLRLQQVFAALYYYSANRDEIDKWIAANRIPEEWSGKRFDPASRQVT